MNPAEDEINNEEGDEEVIFTRDEDFNELIDRDETTEITGYVDEVHAPKVVGTKAKYDLFKFILNNDSSRRITCLVWGKPLIEKYVNNIVIGKIVKIEGAVTKAVSMTYYKETNNIVPFELLIEDNTKIKFRGERAAQVNQERVVQRVNFDTIGRTNGLISVEGYIKMKFTKTENKYKATTYGCGSITDGNFKVTVHITNFTDLNINKGVLVRIIGEVETGGPVVIVCRDENCVIPVEGAQKMTSLQLSRGVKTPKRGLE